MPRDATFGPFILSECRVLFRVNARSEHIAAALEPHAKQYFNASMMPMPEGE